MPARAQGAHSAAGPAPSEDKAAIFTGMWTMVGICVYAAEERGFFSGLRPSRVTLISFSLTSSERYISAAD